MPFRQLGSLKSFSIARSIRRLVQKQRSLRNRRVRMARRRLIEQLEPRNLMALSILSVSPLDGATNVPVGSNLVITFNEPVLKGQGNIHVLRQSTGTLGVAVDVTSPNVAVTGSVVTIDLPVDLQLDNTYDVVIDNGAFKDATTGLTSGATLLTQHFDFLPLGPFVTESGGDGTDFTLTPPLGFTVDNSLMPADGVPEWRGWSFADKNAWAQVDDQSRSAFGLASGAIAVGDSDEWDDAPHPPGNFNSFLITKPISLAGVTASSAVLEFDSSFRPEDSQIGELDVRFDNGVWERLLTLNPTNTSNEAPNATNNIRNVNEHLTSGVNTGVSSDGKGNAAFRAVQNPATATTMQFRWRVEGGNDWWWGLDNLKVTGQIVGAPFAGVSNRTFFNFSTPESPKLSLAIDKTTMSENGGTAIGTVSRNGLPTGDLVVTLSSNDTTEATVPATVTIPNGQAAANFTITAVDDALSDRTQTVTISVTATNFAASSRSIDVLDDEGPKILTLSPADNATGVNYQSNLAVTFDVNVKKGSGQIHLIQASTNTLGVSIDVNSPNVTVSGPTVTIDPPINLFGLAGYYVLVDDGALLDTSTTPSANTVLLNQTFDLLPLRPFVTEPGGDGTDFTKTPPLGFTVDNGGMPGGSNSDFDGWSFMDKNSWVATAGNQGRGDFARATGNVAVADPDEWDDVAHNTGAFNSFLRTAPINLAGVAAGSVVLEFDSSYRPELPQIGSLQVSYDGGTNWIELLAFDSSDARNARVSIGSTATVGTVIGGGTVRNALVNPTSGNMIFRFGLLNAGNNWWWAVDNIKVTGQVVGVPFQGISSASIWNFTTAEAPTLTVTIDKTSMSENGGSAIGTVTRNLSNASSPALTVTLNSSDTTEATVPANVTIPAGAASITFPIASVDDTVADGNQVVTVTATATDFFNVPASINVTDDDFPKVNTLSPADNATAVPVGANLVVTFDQSVKQGNGFVHIVRASDDKSAVSIDVQSPAVTIAGAVVTINPPVDLAGLTAYYVRFENGAILSNSTNPTPGATLLSQDFELLPLGPAVFETVGLTPNGRDFTTVPPTGYAIDNSQMPPGGVPEWNGWSFADKSFWSTQGGQGRANFARGTGTVAVADDDEWDDTSTLNNSFNSLFITSPIALSTVAQNSAVLEFDSSFRPEDSAIENNQVGKLDVSFDGGTNWTNLLTLDRNNTSGVATAPNVNERRSLNVANPGTGSMRFRFGLTGTNDFWWAIDNVKVTGNTNGLAFPGILDATTWNFTTAEAQTLTLAIPAAPIAENGGTVQATVSRNLGTTGDLVVTLTSGNTSIATVPATVTIPNGQASAVFTVTAADDIFFDGSKKVSITATATATGFVGGAGTVSVSDNETGDLIVTEIMFNPAGAEPRTEWFEILNRGSTAADLGGWTFDDEDTSNWGPIAAGTLLEPGKVAVIYNGFFNANTETLFRTEWNIPAQAVVRGIFWGSLDNSPSAVAGSINENVRLVDAGNATIDVVNFDDDGTVWPASANGPSIYLTNVGSNNDLGSNWRLSASGSRGARNAAGPNFNVADIGSPGVVPSSSSIYHKGSTFSEGGANVAAALDPVKVLARATDALQTLSYANLLNSTRGINGIVLDIAGLPAASLTAADFVFRMSPTGLFDEAANPPSGWSAAPNPTAIVVTPGSGIVPARVRLEWDDNSIANRWLQVQVRANANTGLLSTEVYYVGHLQGELNGQILAGAYFVNNTDIAMLPPIGGGATTISNSRDVDKNGFVLNADGVAVRSAIVSGLSLRNITVRLQDSGAASLLAGRSTIQSPLDAPRVFTPETTLQKQPRDVVVSELPDYLLPDDGPASATKSSENPVSLVTLDRRTERRSRSRAEVDDFFGELGQEQFSLHDLVSLSDET